MDNEASVFNCRSTKWRGAATAALVLICLCVAVSCQGGAIQKNVESRILPSTKEIKDAKTSDENSGLTVSQSENLTQCKSRRDDVSPNDKSADGLNKMLGNLVGDFVVDEKQESVFEADFNGDGCQDIAVIIGATDARHQIKDINDAAANTNIAVTRQNLRTDSKLLPQEGKSRGNIFPKTMLSQSDRALVIIHGGQFGWNWKHGNAGAIFLLIDAVFTKRDCPDCHSALVLRKSETQGSDCFPKNSKGEGLLTGGEEAGKLIFFDGAKYAWTQCGD